MKILETITYLLALAPYAVLIIYRKPIIEELKECAKALFTEEYDHE